MLNKKPSDRVKEVIEIKKNITQGIALDDKKKVIANLQRLAFDPACVLLVIQLLDVEVLAAALKIMEEQGS